MKAAFAILAIALCLQNGAFASRSLSQLPTLADPAAVPAPAPGPSADSNSSCALGALQQAGTFNTLLELIASSSEADEFIDLLSSPTEQATVFAPTDAGIAKIAASLGSELTTIVSNPELVSNIIMYHILPSTLKPADLQDTYSFVTLYDVDNVSQSVAVQGNGVTASIVAANSTAPIVSSLTVCDFAVYPIDGVLLPALN